MRHGASGLGAFVFAALAGLGSGCGRGAPEPSASSTPVVEKSATARERVEKPASASSASVAQDAPRDDDPSFRSPSPERLLAIGDLHGDLAVTRRALRLGHVIDAQDRWVGGKTVVVQTGDEIDRGDDDRAIIDLFDRLADSAKAVGGRVIALNGNHEVMNVSSDFRYVTEGGFSAFADVDASKVPRAVADSFPVAARGRLAAFSPGGPYAARLAQRDVLVLVGTSLFVHGGVTLDHVRYGIARINRETRRWMNGQGVAPKPVQDQEGPIWTRRYSNPEGEPDCDGARATLKALGAHRMVMGHTVQPQGITMACDGQVVRIDAGLSHYYGGPVQILEIRGDEVQILRESK